MRNKEQPRVHLRVVIALERDEVVVASVRSLQRPAVLRRYEIIAVSMGKQRRHKRAARGLDGCHVMQVKAAAPLYGDAKQRDCSRDQELGQSDAGDVPTAAVRSACSTGMWREGHTARRARA